MPIADLIKTKLPQDLRDTASKFTIPSDFLDKEPDLIELVLRSRSMDKDEEKQSWFNLLPLMTEEQIAKLRDILTREKQKLSEIEAKYEAKKTEIKQKYLSKRQQAWYSQKIEEIKQKEAESESKDDADADALLENL